MQQDFDIVIIGTGAGGGTLAYALRNAGARILLIERGAYLPQEPENWSPEAVFKQNRYQTSETWESTSGTAFRPGVHYFVGGNTKVYGAALPRFRIEDFEALEHEGGTSPAWPIRYADLEPYYAQAEHLYRAHGTTGEDPTDPPRSGAFPFPALPHAPYMAALIEALKKQGLHPFSLPMGIDKEGSCIRCKTCDGFPCKLHAKSDAEVCCVRPALESPDVSLMTGTLARRLKTNPEGTQVTAVEVERDGKQFDIRAKQFVVSCGAVNSAALLLRSRDGAGLANGSGLVGRNYMVHNNTALMAVNPRKRNPTVFQKTFAVNDYYFNGPDWSYPMGNLQLIGKLQGGMLAAVKPLMPRPILNMMADRSVDWWVMSEDLPDPENRVLISSSGKIQIQWTPNNLESHQKLIAAAERMMKQAGYPFVFTRSMGIETNSHQCGTIRFGEDPATSVLDPYCRAHEVSNLFVVDASFFPSSAAVNPALTIAAQALRVADHMVRIS